MASMVAFCSMYSGAVATTGNAGTSTPRASAMAPTSTRMRPVSVQVP